MEESSWINWEGPKCYLKCPYKKEAQGADTHQEGSVTTQVEIGVLGPEAKECQQPAEARMDSPPDPPEGVRLCRHIDFGSVQLIPCFRPPEF